MADEGAAGGSGGAAPLAARLVDLSHDFPPASKWSRSAPSPVVEPYQTHADSAEGGHYDGCTCEITKVSFVTSLGTYLDSPYHFHPDRQNIADLRLEQLIAPGVVIDVRDVAAAKATIPASVLDGVDVTGRAVLFYTDWSRHWGADEYESYPFLGEAIVAALRAAKPAIVGVDFLTVDDPTDPKRPCHSGLLGDDILISENLTNLGALIAHERAHKQAGADGRAVASGFTYFAVPVKMRPAAAFPNRTFAMFA